MCDELICSVTSTQARTRSPCYDVPSYIVDLTLVRESTLLCKDELVVSASYSSAFKFPGLMDPELLLSLICQCLCAEGSIWFPDLVLVPAYGFATCQWALLVLLPVNEPYWTSKPLPALCRMPAKPLTALSTLFFLAAPHAAVHRSNSFQKLGNLQFTCQ